MFRIRSKKVAPRAASTRTDVFEQEYRRLLERRLDTAVAVTEPLGLISQIQRSGGTLLSQLFDGHPQVHAHPYELKIGFPTKYTWPDLDLSDSPSRWYKLLSERDASRHFVEGYTKFSTSALKELGPGEEPDRFPFLLPPRFQRELFLRMVKAREIGSVRDVIDCYMTSYFNAWLDNHNLYTGPKRLVTGFTPRLVMDSRSVDRFFGTYPDGTLICVVREPKAWWMSAKRHHPEEYGEPDTAVDLWLASTSAILNALEREPARVVVCAYERLVQETVPTMRSLASRLGIDFSETLTSPTFNGSPIRADSSFRVDHHGIIMDPVSRAGSLEPALARRIDERAQDLYRRAAARAA